MANVLGIDIQSSVLRMVLARTSLRQLHVSGYAEIDLKATPKSDVAELIRSTLTALNPSTAGVADWSVSCLDGRHASQLLVALPAKAAREIGAVLPFELESIVPYEVDEAVIDFQPTSHKTKDEVQILCAAVKRTLLGQHLDQLAELGFSPRQVAVGACALDGLSVFIPELKGPETRWLLHIERDHSDLCIVQNGVAQFSRTLSVGTQTFIQQTAMFESEFRQTLLYCKNANLPAPTELLVSGEGALYPQILSWIENETHFSTRILPLPEAPGAGSESRAVFGKAAALVARAVLSGRHINVRQGDFALKQTVGALRQHARLVVVCASAILLAFSLSTCAQALVLKKEREGLRKQLGMASASVLGENTEDIERVEALMKGSDPGFDDPLPKVDAFDVLNVLSEGIAESINHEAKLVLVELGTSEQAGRLQLRGTVASIGERDQIAAALQKHKCLRKLEKGGVTPAIGESRLNYEIEAGIVCDKGSKGE